MGERDHAAVAFTRVGIRGIRNILELLVDPGPRLNVVLGDNGQGKTSLLEALYLVATSRSFRTERLSEVVRDGSEQGVVAVTVEDGVQPYDQRAVLAKQSNRFLLDGKRPERLSAFAVRTPVVVFHPGDLGLVSGPAVARRTLLDRVALYLDPQSAEHRTRYARALRERQQVLEKRGAEAAELDVFEEILAEHGSKLTRTRASATLLLTESLKVAFAQMGPRDLELATTYVPAGSTDKSVFAEELRRSRLRDLRRRAAAYGPQRDELELALNGRSARRSASQGQQRIVSLAIKLAELGCIRELRSTHPILLLDDVSSELDPQRTGAVYAFLLQSRSQIFVTTTRPELFPTPSLSSLERQDWVLENGALKSGSGA